MTIIPFDGLEESRLHLRYAQIEDSLRQAVASTSPPDWCI
jgi:hypothetical protein